MIRLNDSEFSSIVDFMRDNYGINLEKKKVLIECRLTKALDKYEAKSFAEFLRMMKRDRTGTIAGEMVNRLTTNYTYFMREPAHFTILREQILPQMFARRHISFCNIWCAGCSTGEESYTLAMLLQDYKAQEEWTPNIRILATDISQEVLDIAQKGIYPLKEMESLPVAWQKNYCHIIPGKKFKLDEKLKYHIRFRKQNLMDEVPEGEKFDLIFCRNVMIYFDKNSKEKLLRRLEACLKPGGYLFVGLAELLSRDETTLETVYPAVYRNTKEMLNV